MRSSIKFLVGFLILIGAMLLIITVFEVAEGKTIIVSKDGNGDYEKIQDAIDNATEGDTIRVWEGTYEENVVVNKTVSLVGNGSEETTIDAHGHDSVVNITSDWVNMSQFIVTNSGMEFYPEIDSGIKVLSNNNNINTNYIVNNKHGITFFNSSFNTFSNN